MADLPKDEGGDPLTALRAAVLRLATRSPLKIGHESTAVEVQGDQDKLFAQVREEIAARRAGLQVNPAPPRRSGVDAMSVPPVRTVRGPVALQAGPRQHVNEIFAYQGEDFVVAAYRAVLGREVDPAALEHFSKSIHAGTMGRVELLQYLAESEEGRLRGVHVEGLAQALRRRRMARWPVVGPLMRVLVSMLDVRHLVPALERQAFENQRREAELGGLVDAFNAHAAQVHAAADRAHEQAVRLHADNVALKGQLATLQSELRSSNPRAEMAQLGSAVLVAAEQMAALIAAQREALELKADDAVLREALRAESDALAAKLAATEVSLAGRMRGVEAGLAQGLAVPDDALGAMDSFYADFEDRFRGPRELIRERLEEYVPHMHASRAGSPERAILDVGCGRGEWLELLRDTGLAASGIDLNGKMVAMCRERGLDVAKADAMEHLESLPPASLGAITAFHVIEHLTLQQLIRLVDAALRALAPGGILVCETPNPENLTVGACSFWNDPTHMRPLPPDPTAAILAMRGFHPVEILRLHPGPAHLPQGDRPDEVRDTLNHILYGPQDYALLATKPR